MYIRIALSVFIILLWGCNGIPHDTNPPQSFNAIKAQENNPVAVEYTVYDALINEMYLSDQTDLVVIRNQTSVSDGFVGEGLTSTLQYVNQQIPGGISQEIIDDFQAKNRQPVLLRDLFRIKAKYTLMDQSEWKSLHQKSDGFWNAFYLEYPRSQGVLTLSQVGFNREMNKALVYVGNRRDGKIGAGFYVLLVFENGDWNIQHKVEVWVS